MRAMKRSKMTKRIDTEPIRRVLAGVAQWGGWAASVGLLVYSIQFHPEKGDFAPQWVGLTFVMCIGVAIAGTLVRSRMRLTNTIMAAFRAGASLRAKQEANAAARESSQSIREEAAVQREANQMKRDEHDRKD